VLYFFLSAVENQAMRQARPPGEELAPQRFGDCAVSKKPRKSRRSSRQDSPPMEADDSEDNDTSQATHNVLERQRREDLKCRFQYLRDSIPELEKSAQIRSSFIFRRGAVVSRQEIRTPKATYFTREAKLLTTKIRRNVK